MVRAKRGGLQSAKDGQSGTKQPKSAGASLRRYNETALNGDVRQLLLQWQPELSRCQLLFVQAPVTQRGVIHNGKAHEGKIDKKDPRLRGMPFVTGRPTLREMKRAHSILAAIYHHDVANNEPHAANPASHAKKQATHKVKQTPPQQTPSAPKVQPEDPDRYINAPLYEACCNPTTTVDDVAVLLSDAKTAAAESVSHPEQPRPESVLRPVFTRAIPFC